MVVQVDDIERALKVYRRYLESMEKLGPEEAYKLETMAPVASSLLDLTGKLIVQKEMAKKLGLNPNSRRGAPREALPWYGSDQQWEITYALNDERRTFRGIGELNKLIVVLQNYALYAGKKLELTGATRIRSSPSPQA